MNDQKDKQRLIFKATVGSQAHGLATPESDFDFRGVFIVPTREILSLGSTTRTTNWIEGKDDDTSWEIAHFLHLATKCNPTILEVFLSPIAEVADDMKLWMEELRALFPYIWNSQYVRDAFIGYAHNQRKKLLDGKDIRPHKYAAAYLRVLYNAKELLETGTFNVNIGSTEFGEYVRKVKNKDPNISLGDIINRCQTLEQEVRDAFDRNPNKETDFEKVNDFLLKVRQAHWTL